jgi:hypothetical protein
MAESISEYRLSEHARFELDRRRISESIVADILASPGQTFEVREGRMIFQSKIEMGAPSKTYLVRVFVDVDQSPPVVVTVYRTSKIGKYWRDEA